MAQPLETVSVVDAATARLRESLFSGEFAAGQEIKDTQIAAAYGIARPTARIAVQQLINEGMLVRPPGFSARVRTFDPSQVRDLYRVRTMIELDAVRGIRAQGLMLDGVADALQGFAGLRDGDDWGRLAEADVNFHASVVAASGSPRLRTYFTGIAGETRLLIALLKAQYQRGSELYDEHEHLFSLLAGDGSEREVESQWFKHLDGARVFLEGLLAAN